MVKGVSPNAMAGSSSKKIMEEPKVFRQAPMTLFPINDSPFKPSKYVGHEPKYPTASPLLVNSELAQVKAAVPSDGPQ